MIESRWDLHRACGWFTELIYSAVGETFARKSVKPIQGYHLIRPEDQHWRPSKL